MPEIISKYQEADTATNPMLYRVPSVYGNQVIVNAKSERRTYDIYRTDRISTRGVHRPGPNTFPFRALSADDTQQLPIVKFHLGKYDHKPSWKRESWWERNRHTIKPHAIAVGIGLLTMIGALCLAEFGAGTAGAATVASNPPPVHWGPSNVYPAPMPRRCVLPVARGMGVHTLELRLPIQRCAQENIPVGNVSE